ncbi:hypothetical protein ACFX13_000805 [Malus domestica]
MSSKNVLEGQADEDELSRACKVACWCIKEDEKDRPTMRQVVQILEGVSDIGVPPIPQFLQNLTESPVENINYQETDVRFMFMVGITMQRKVRN